MSQSTKKRYPSGYIYYRNEKGQYHREDGPAIEYSNGYKAWWINDNRHRLDGPAIEYPNGEKAWYLNDKALTEEEFKRRTTRLGRILYL